jgi:subtilisin family serine protease
METRFKSKAWISLGCLIGTCLNFSYAADHSAEKVEALVLEQSEARLLVRWKDGSIRAQTVGAKTYKHLPNLELISVPDGQTLKQTINDYQNNPNVAYAEPDYRVQHWAITPNDPDFSELWGLHNESDTDINAPEAWDITLGSAEVVVAVIDSGIDYNHTDLANNVWQNPNEIAGNGIDDDENGYVDDIYGIDAVNDDSDPYDDDGHGTHVAGTIAAEINNSKGVVGVAPNTKVISCKFLDEYGYGYNSDAIECLDYLYDLKVTHGINIVVTNNSWGGGGYSSILEEAISRHNDEDILFIAAAGNSGLNIDVYDSYPANFDLDNIITVAAVDENEELAYFSNYGTDNVDIAAPGVEVYSTLPGDTYGDYDGTSMAAPHVTGAIALLAAVKPDFTAAQYKQLIIDYGQEVSNLVNAVGSSNRLVLWNDNDSGPLNCDGVVRARILEPLESVIQTTPGDELDIYASISECAEPVTGANYDVILNNQVVGQLVDDGSGNDEQANDGVYSSVLTINFVGESELNFSGGIESAFSIVSAYEPVIETTTYDYQEIEGIELIGSNRDDSVSVIEPGFTVQWPLGGIDTLFVSSNGIIASEYSSVYWNSSLPTNSLSHAVYPFWDDLVTANGGVYYEIVGEAPNRQLVIEYRDVIHYGYSNDDDEYKMTFQVIMYENTPEIVLNYKDVDVADAGLSNGGSATVGYEYEGSAIQLSYNEAIIESGTSYRIQQSNNNHAQITSVSFSDVLKVTYPVEISFEYTVPEDAESVSLSIDLGDGNSESLDLDAASYTHAYSESGLYQVNLLLEADGFTASKVFSVNIEALTDLEQQLIDIERDRLLQEIDSAPDEYGLITLDALEQALAEEADDVLNEILTSPEEHGLIASEDLELVTFEKISELEAGTHLLGSSVEITNLQAIFSDAQLVWVYQDDGFLGWSPDSEMQTKVLNTGYGQLSEIKAGTGFWVKK